jgi:tetratricopeptide (TPR) repeat protein
LYLRIFATLQVGDFAGAQKFISGWRPEPVSLPEPLLGIFIGILHLLENHYSQAEKEFQRYVDTLKLSPRLDMLSLGLAFQGYTAYCMGRLEEARQYLLQALENGLTQGFFMGLQVSLSTLALMLAEEDPEAAIELKALADAQFAERSVVMDVLFGEPITARVAALTAEQLQAASDRGRMVDLSQTAAVYLEKIR